VGASATVKYHYFQSCFTKSVAEQLYYCISLCLKDFRVRAPWMTFPDWEFGWGGTSVK
jgi:hypothetical protein